MVTRLSRSWVVAVVVVVCLSLAGMGAATGADTKSLTAGPASPDASAGFSTPAPDAPTGSDGNDSTLRRDSTGTGVPAAAPGSDTIDVDYTVERTPSAVGTVRVTYTATVPDSVVKLRARFNGTGEDITVESATNASYDPSVGAWVIDSSGGSTTTGTLVYTANANVTSHVFSEFNSVETPDWAFVATRRIGARHSWSYFGASPAFEDTYTVDGEGYATEGYLFLGPYDAHRRAGSNQSLVLVVPSAATPATPPSTVLSGLASVADGLRVGAADPEVTGFALPSPIRAGGGARGDSFWINANRTLADTTWYHEYTHTRQVWQDRDSSLRAADDIEWFTEASADYYGALLAWETGEIDARSFRRLVSTSRDASTILQDPDGISAERKNYYKGRRVLAALDIRIRRQTDGKNTLADVFRYVNGLSGEEFTYADLRSEIVRLTDESTGAWLDGYLTNRSAPSIPADVTSVYGDASTPTADAGADRSVVPGSTVTLSGTNSTASDGGGLTYAWTQTGGPSVPLSDAGTATPTFTAPSGESETSLTFELSVTDAGGDTDTDTVTITVASCLSAVSLPYDGNGDCAISLVELGQASKAFANGTLTLVELGEVSKAFANTSAARSPR